MIPLYFHLLFGEIKGQMYYKTSFLLEILGYFLLNSMELFATYSLFLKFPSIKGWTIGEIFTLQGIAISSFGMAKLFGESLEKAPELIRTGKLDQLLTRPVPVILQIMPLSFQLKRIGVLLNGCIALTFASFLLKIPFTFERIMLLIIALFSSTIIYFGIFLMGAASCFWTIQSSEIINVFTYGGTECSRYPITIYRPWMKLLFLYFIPLGFVTYTPMLLFFQKTNPSGNPLWIAYFSPFVAGLFLYIAWSFWKIGINHYQSTGS